MNFNALNFVYNFNSSNTIIFNTCSFHYCSFREQNVITCHHIFLYFFCLTVQNNFVIINLKRFYKNILEDNYNIFNTFLSHGT